MTQVVDKSKQDTAILLETLSALQTCRTKTEAAQKLGLSREGLYKRIDKYGLDKYLEEIQEDALEILKKATIKAALNLEKKIDNTNPNISMEASKEVLDRAGVTKPKEVSQTNVQVNNFIPLLGGDSAKNAVSENTGNREDTTTQQED